jgi:hypothetical protein
MADVSRPGAVTADEQRLDPKLSQLTAYAAPPSLPTYLVLGLPICFTIALGILVIGFRGAFTPESLVLFTLGAIGLILVPFFDRRSRG